MKKHYLVAAGILAVAIGGAFLLVRSKSEPPTGAPPPRTPLVQTVGAEVRSGALEVLGAGTVRAADVAAVAPQVSGRVVYVAPQLVSGGRVAAGQVLLRIDGADYRNRVQQARADIAAQDVAVLQAQEEADLARREYAQYRDRRAARAASPYGGVDADDYAARILPPEGAPVARTPTPATDAGGPSALALRQPQLEAARAGRMRAQAALDDAQLALSRTVVRAPFSGLVESETVAVGDVVGAGQAVARVIAARAVEAVVPLSDAEAALVPDLFSGRPVEASVYADFGRLRYRWRAVVDRVEATRDAVSRTLNVVLRVADPIAGGRIVDPGDGDRAAQSTIVPTAPPPLLPGTYVEAEIRGAEVDRYVVVPRRALRRGNQVWAVRQDTLLAVVRVDVLQQVGEDVLVQGDLADGVPVVTTDLQGVVDGMTVRLASRQSGGSGSGPGPQAANAGAGR